MDEFSKDYLYSKTKSFLDANGLTYLPPSLKSICTSYGWTLIPYGKHLPQLSKISSDGFSVHRNGKFYIFYSDQMPITRQRFTIAHEIGHIILGHHQKLQSTVLASHGYGIWEDHANIFARNILMPPKLTKHLLAFDSKPHRYFNVSKQMAEVRLKYLDQDLNFFI